MGKEEKKIDKGSSKNDKILSQKEVKKLIDSIYDMRDKLSASILYETGCSLSELVKLKVGDIDGNIIKINDEETNMIRNSKISDTLANKISLFIRGNGLDKNRYLFSTKKSDHISEKRTREIIQFCAEKIGYGKINPQMFRYLHIAHAYQNGVLLDNISKQLGIKRFRVFQVIEELNIECNEDRYKNFYESVEELE